ncbi:hypothetical protein [Clostridioides sp. ES-S-0049-03]|uniref:hypothetical protein n=1 Tax=Clostridioides sp. ES-S-0049-03 TaxID=2770779 RepID=UPI001D104178|nr:hypothetical protein [Clostridioides sp. ES-S-0049-03]
MHDVKIETSQNTTKIIIDGYDVGDVMECKVLGLFVENGMKNELSIKLSVKNLEIVNY